ncbi:MAG TPA: CPBP family intramembrane glutamic endopeptidase [Symbiobacteriaceae bacterium]|nr:CPBP family intramembrane glutamic endopeptidase [Symbiobacteriaceae bacterium]
MLEREPLLPDREPWTPAASFVLLISILGWLALTGMILHVAGPLLRAFLPHAVIARWGSPVTFVVLEAVWLLLLRRHHRRRGVKPLWQGAELRSPVTWLLLLGAVSLCVGTSLLRFRLAEGSFGGGAAGLASLGPVQWGPSLMVLAAGAGLAPVTEEWLFRGILQEALTRRWGPWLSIPVTSLAFGALHGLASMWVVAAYGLVLGYLAHRRHSLTVPIIVHALINLLAMSIPLLLALFNS